MKNTILYTLISFLIILTGCEDPYKQVDWDLASEEKRLIVEGGISNEYKRHTIYLRETSDYFANDPNPMVSDATVHIADGDNNFPFVEENPGEYVSVDSFAGIPEKIYNLQIELANPLNNETSYQASNTIIPGIPVDSLVCNLYENSLGFSDETDSTIAIFYVFGQEPAEYENYYSIRLFVNDSLLQDTINEVQLSNDVEFEYNGATVNSWFFIQNITKDDSITFEITSISKQYYEFIEGIKQIASGTDPFGFSGPPANPNGNIEGGEALGFFTANFVSRGTTVPVDRRDEN